MRSKSHERSRSRKHRTYGAVTHTGSMSWTNAGVERQSRVPIDCSAACCRHCAIGCRSTSLRISPPNFRICCAASITNTGGRPQLRSSPLQVRFSRAHRPRLRRRSDPYTAEEPFSLLFGSCRPRSPPARSPTCSMPSGGRTCALDVVVRRRLRLGAGGVVARRHLPLADGGFAGLMRSPRSGSPQPANITPRTASRSCTTAAKSVPAA